MVKNSGLTIKNSSDSSINMRIWEMNIGDGCVRTLGDVALMYSDLHEANYDHQNVGPYFQANPFILLLYEGGENPNHW